MKSLYYPQQKPQLLLLLLTLLLSLYVGVTYAQNIQGNHHNLLAEYSEGRLYLVYLPTPWPEGMKSYMVKAKINGTWQPLHPHGIVPGIALGSDLAHLGENTLRQQVEAKRDQLISTGQLREISREALITALSDERQSVAIKMFLGRDFDLLLASGLGFTAKIEPKLTEIGLFSENTLVGSIETAQIPTNEYALSVEGKHTKTGKTLKLEWAISIEEYEAHQVLTGFNIYRKERSRETLVNEVPIYMSRKEGKGYIYHEETLKNDSTAIEFTLRPVSLFNTEGKGTGILYNPIGEKTGLLFHNPGIGRRGEDGAIWITWESEEEGKTLIIETRGNLSGDWKELAKVKATDQEYQHLGNSKESDVVLYRIRSARAEQGQVQYSEVLSYSQEAAPLPSPKIMEAELEDEAGFIRLKWEYPETGISLRGVQLHTSYGEDTSYLSESSEGLITDSPYRWELPAIEGRISVALKAIGTDGRVSELSEPQDLEIPVKYLPEVVIVKVKKEGQRLEFYWDYGGRKKIEGFRIYRNEEIVKEVAPDKSRAILERLEGEKATYNITAYIGEVESCRCQGVEY